MEIGSSQARVLTAVILGVGLLSSASQNDSNMRMPTSEDENTSLPVGGTQVYKLSGFRFRSADFADLIPIHPADRPAIVVVPRGAVVVETPINTDMDGLAKLASNTVMHRYVQFLSSFAAVAPEADPHSLGIRLVAGSMGHTIRAKAGSKLSIVAVGPTLGTRVHKEIEVRSLRRSGGDIVLQLIVKVAAIKARSDLPFIPLVHVPLGSLSAGAYRLSVEWEADKMREKEALLTQYLDFVVETH